MKIINDATNIMDNSKAKHIYLTNMFKLAIYIVDNSKIEMPIYILEEGNKISGHEAASLCVPSGRRRNGGEITKKYN